MKTTSTVVMVCLVFAALTMVGCSTTVKLMVANESSKTFPVKISDGGHGPRNLGLISGEGQPRWNLKYKNSKLPVSVVLTVGKQVQTFNVSKDGSKVFRYRISTEGKLEARAEVLTVDVKEDTKEPIGGPVEEVTGD